MLVDVDQKKASFLSQFKGLKKASGKSLNAETALQELTFPTSREEYWKYTRLSKIHRSQFCINETNENVEFSVIDNNAIQINCVNGFFRKESQNLPKGVSLEPILEITHPQADYTNEFFSALNTAYFTSGISICIEPNINLENPIQINFITTSDGIIAQPRIEIDLKKNARASVIINSESSEYSNGLWNTVSEMCISENSTLNVHQIQKGGQENFSINTVLVEQKRDSRFNIDTICLEGKILRNNLNISVEGENCETHLNGIYLVSNSEHFDNHTYVDHRAPNCFSSENYKGIIDDSATAVFNGKVMVQPNAQKINAFQSNQNILLSDNATVNSKPELEIYADDVQCAHGSTTGQLDEEALFYLQSRGVSNKSARKMLIRAFVFDVLEKINLSSFRKHVESLVDKKFKV